MASTKHTPKRQGANRRGQTGRAAKVAASGEPTSPSANAERSVTPNRSRPPTRPAGRRVRGSRSGRPILVALDLLGRRWTLRVIWELRDGPHTFRALRERCDDVSPTSLNTRIAELRERGIITMTPSGYGLSNAGWELFDALRPLLSWSERWLDG